MEMFYNSMKLLHLGDCSCISMVNVREAMALKRQVIMPADTPKSDHSTETAWISSKMHQQAEGENWARTVIVLSMSRYKESRISQ